MAEQTTPPAGRRELTRRQVYALRAAWLGLVVIVSVGVGAVVGDALLPAWGGWAVIAQVTVSLALMVLAGWSYEGAVGWLRDWIEREVR